MKFKAAIEIFFGCLTTFKPCQNSSWSN